MTVGFQVRPVMTTSIRFHILFCLGMHGDAETSSISNNFPFIQERHSHAPFGRIHPRYARCIIPQNPKKSKSFLKNFGKKRILFQKNGRHLFGKCPVEKDVRLRTRVQVNHPSENCSCSAGQSAEQFSRAQRNTARTSLPICELELCLRLVPSRPAIR